MKKKPLKFSLRMVQGAIGKRFVVKHYRYGIVMTRYPDMSRIVASKKQRKCRDLFKEAVGFAKYVMGDEELKAAWSKLIGKSRRPLNAIVKAYMLMEKEEAMQRIVTGNRILVRVMKKVDCPQSTAISRQSAVISRYLQSLAGRQLLARISLKKDKI